LGFFFGSPGLWYYEIFNKLTSVTMISFECNKKVHVLGWHKLVELGHQFAHKLMELSPQLGHHFA
jgi:hypothetical protein